MLFVPSCFKLGFRDVPNPDRTTENAEDEPEDHVGTDEHLKGESRISVYGCSRQPL